MADPNPFGRGVADGYRLDVTSLVNAGSSMEEGMMLFANGTLAAGATRLHGVPETPVPGAHGLNSWTPCESSALKSPVRSAEVKTVQVPPPPLQEEVGG